ncbi:YjzD family protein [Bombilactobacillus thymidiniphilus]|uniref:YjzD family protein n=1 Tax=Bombilactobacillus thymidiniphilus TaxID=2923363 RepID=A0ABY4PDY5_9LACO|nr:YjzD family protein [Bombilactobacillus thymidiniphilus]UQS83731.1 YjzD family protein [Bombilactobacillus thymidiniphilus]
MKYLITLFWTVVYGQIIGYLGAALTKTQYSVNNCLVISLIFGVIFCLLAAILNSEAKDTKKSN